MKDENFSWMGKKARKTLAGLLVVTSAWYFGISGIKDYLINKDFGDCTGTNIGFSDIENKTPAKKVQTEFETYLVKYGDTLSEIAEKYSIPMKELVYWNGIQNPDLIYENQELKIPVREERK